ncbi:hypothetical protein ElyMa_006817700 [Elysia marginata]|uniref:DUF7869 domain-containing protein n=1 Tax=Elysia marginata TaxID=1093978 RepID=A0AAV4J5L2_9GAST|nr:hypothetical protein ElyMa_006817700 [Elysia marginata]
MIYFTTIVPAEVKTLVLFCDSCAGQNKNWSVIRYLHFLTAHLQRFDEIKMSFPIRGHSYMECDRDMAVINQKARVEVLDDWIREFEAARKNPSPFIFVRANQGMFLGMAQHLKKPVQSSLSGSQTPHKGDCLCKAAPKINPLQE